MGKQVGTFGFPAMDDPAGDAGMEGVHERFRSEHTQDELDSLEIHLVMLRKAIVAEDPEAELLIRVDDILREIASGAPSEELKPVAWRVSNNGKYWDLRKTVPSILGWAIVEPLYAHPAPTAAAWRTVPELTYGQKLIAEAIEAHFGERVVDYDEDVDDTSNHDAWEAFDDMFAAHSTPTAAPVVGWKLVPADPTEAMWQAGRYADVNYGDSYTKVYCAMLEAAPSPPDTPTWAANPLPDAEWEQPFDVVATFNMRDWLRKAAETQGAHFTGGSVGPDDADIDIELDGCKFNITIRAINRLPADTGLVAGPTQREEWLADQSTLDRHRVRVLEKRIAELEAKPADTGLSDEDEMVAFDAWWQEHYSMANLAYTVASYTWLERAHRAVAADTGLVEPVAWQRYDNVAALTSPTWVDIDPAEKAEWERLGYPIRALVPADALARLQAEHDKARKEVDMLLSTAAANGDEPDLMLQEFDRLNADLAAAREQIAALQADFNDCNSERARWRGRAESAEQQLITAQEMIARMTEVLQATRAILILERFDSEAPIPEIDAALTLAKDKTDGQ